MISTLIALALLAAPPAEPTPPGPREPSRLVASAWCSVHDGDDDGPGCDVGLGVALARRQRISWVAVVGSETLGTGISWTANPDRRPGQPLVAVAAGVIVRYDSSGVDGSEVYPAVGATLSFGGRR